MTSPAPTNKALPPTMPVAIKRETNNGSSNVRAGITRRDSLGWGADDLLGMISHTPPAFSPGSLTMPMTKRGRSGSISSRLLSATDLEERGIIDRQQKGVLKDLIISGDEALQKALEKFDAGDASSLEALLDSGALNRKSSVDLLDDLDLGFLNVGSLGDTPKDEPYSTSARSESMDEWDELHFESAFHDSRDLLDTEFYGSSLGTSLPNSLPSMGLGITPPASFSFGEDFLESKVKSETSSTNTNGDEVKAHRDDASAATGEAGDSGTAASGAMSRPIGIPGAAGNVTTPGGLSRPFGAIDLNKPKPGGAPGAAGEAGGDKKPFVGAYSPDSRRKRIDKFLDKRLKRVWRKEVKYDVRKNFADSRLRVKGRFVKKEDEQLLRELLSFT